jgi:hypothetical protein
MSAFLTNLPVKVLDGRCLAHDPLPHPPLHTVLIHVPVYLVYSHREWGQVDEPVRRLKGR